MSIAINGNKCAGCGRCVQVCPGSLIRLQDGRAVIKREKDCWGCTSCIKECPTGAILFFLGADLGGAGSQLSVRHDGDIAKWTVTAPSGETQTISVNKNDSNKY